MKVTRIRNTAATVQERGDGTHVLVSYSTPVAAFVPGRGYLRTDRRFSRTTNRHVSEWTGKRATTVPHAEILAIAEG